ncbi:hypothetical protein LZ30DRAFT_743202 [Colletotrichum cereale]|nr:hypothetical protein LZ30DRAFT_743202 [Colletotrichum cereale]
MTIVVLRNLLLVVAAVGAGRLVQAETALTPPGSTFTGSPSNCNKWFVIADRGNCETVEAEFGRNSSPGTRPQTQISLP